MTALLSTVDAQEALSAAVSSLGAGAGLASMGGDHDTDVHVHVPGGSTIAVKVTTMALVNAEAAHRLRNHTVHLPDPSLHVVVATRITSAARVVLNEAGLGWLDLRGHLRLVGPGVLVDTAVPGLSDPVAERSGIFGQVGMELAALLLMEPQRTWRVRSAAAALSRAPSSVSTAFASLRNAHLLTNVLQPDGTGLFWELAQHWGSTRADVASLPGRGRGRDNAALRLGFADVETTTGWALTDTVAAARYGAPLAIRSDHPLDLYVPDRSTLRRALHLLGPATNASQRAGQVRVAPVPAVCERRLDASGWSDEHWPLAHPLFVALDLAQDPGRGREILSEWTPAGPAQRVW